MTKKKTPRRSGKPAGKRPKLPPIRKPQMTLDFNPEMVRQAEQEQAAHPPSLLGLAIRLLPVWALLVMILILEPTLPFRAVAGMFGWVAKLVPEAAEPQVPDQVFVVEGAEGIQVQSELPPPDWPLDISPVFTDEVQYWAEDIANWSLVYRVRPNMIATLMQIESCGDPTVVSPAGAQGLFQVVPLHFEEGEDPFDPDVNAQRGLLYFGEMLAAANGDIGLAYAAYNGGPTVLSSSPADWDSETQNYQYWSSGLYEEAEGGFAESPTLIEWLEAGGASLCAGAADVLGL
jgi:hypothetical protein